VKYTEIEGQEGQDEKDETDPDGGLDGRLRVRRLRWGARDEASEL
jgi:hypothetical protein